MYDCVRGDVLGDARARAREDARTSARHGVGRARAVSGGDGGVFGGDVRVRGELEQSGGRAKGRAGDALEGFREDVCADVRGVWGVESRKDSRERFVVFRLTEDVVRCYI